MKKPSSIFGRLGNQMFQGAYIYAQMRDGAIDDIYVQDPKYFEKYRSEIMKLYGDGIGYKNKVAIHVRRGDYVDNPFYVDLTKTDYYKRAIAEFPDAKFLVFSDDIDFCKTYFIGEQYEFDESNEIDALNAMASCVGHIIANSSFSWWGAYLAPYTKKVIAPKLWYTDNVERTKTPDSWIRI
jgi:hypothetical protein